MSYSSSSRSERAGSSVKSGGTRRSKEDEDLERAIAASLLEANPSSPDGPASQLRDPPRAAPGYNPSYAPPESSAPAEEDDDPDLAAAIAASLRDAQPQSTRGAYSQSNGAAETYSSLYPSSTTNNSYYPSATAAPFYPAVQASQALPTYDLTPSESTTIYNFTSALERPPPALGTRERELYEEARRAAPQLERGLEDAERRTEILAEMNDKLGEATRLFEGLLDRRVRDAKQRAEGESLSHLEPTRRRRF